MSRRCELTGKAVQSGNNVSHSNRKTRTRFLPNLVQVTLISDALGRSVRLRVAAAALRSVEHRGGLDNFLVKASDADLSSGAVALKREIVKKRAESRSKRRNAFALAQICKRAGRRRAFLAVCARQSPMSRGARGSRA